jgi:hypothetical protein
MCEICSAKIGWLHFLADKISYLDDVEMLQKRAAANRHTQSIGKRMRIEMLLIYMSQIGCYGRQMPHNYRSTCYSIYLLHMHNKLFPIYFIH